MHRGWAAVGEAELLGFGIVVNRDVRSRQTGILNKHVSLGSADDGRSVGERDHFPFVLAFDDHEARHDFGLGDHRSSFRNCGLFS